MTLRATLIIDQLLLRGEDACWEGRVVGLSLAWVSLKFGFGPSVHST